MFLVVDLVRRVKGIEDTSGGSPGNTWNGADFFQRCRLDPFQASEMLEECRPALLADTGDFFQ
jgi:hypothetical protein